MARPSKPIVLLAMPLLLVSYVLSAGPVVALTEKGFLPHEIVSLAYAPLFWLAGLNQTAGDLLRWWIYLWFDWLGVGW